MSGRHRHVQENRTEEGPHHARYVDAAGERVAKGTAGARRVTEESDTYYGRVGGKRVSLGTTDKMQAWIKLRDLLRQHAERQAGIRDEYTEQAAVPLAKHLEAWLAAVREEGVEPERLTALGGRLERLAEAAGWKRLADLTKDSCSRGLRCGAGPRHRPDDAQPLPVRSPAVRGLVPGDEAAERRSLRGTQAGGHGQRPPP